MTQRPSTDHMQDAMLHGASYQFNNHVLSKVVDTDVYNRFRKSIDSPAELLNSDKNAIANAMYKWALDHGASQYSHMFFPIRSAGIGVLGGSSGLKHEAFVSLEFGDEEFVKPLTSGFSGSQLFVGETDGSSFPNGGLRTTHQAGAWTAWDRTSPPVVIRDTLYIPCILITQNGKAEDEKLPLLRANDAINRTCLRLLKLIGDKESTKVVSNVGPEQEFFIIDRELYLKRPDLLACGRTIMGVQPPKGQEECLNYFGAIQPRVKKFFDECHEECWRVGISQAVMHNEVAPSQGEVSHIFTLTNVAADWNILTMDIMNTTALKHGLILLLHEKPFAGINGSGKHNNWGLFTDKGDVLFVPGSTDKEQERFMAIMSCFTLAVHRHSDVLRAGIASAGNDFRLGGQEAPPAVLSFYGGEAMEKHIDSIIAGGPLAGYKSETTTIETGCSHVADLTARKEDRNRTSPLPFCGNRIEFRAVGGSQNIAWPLTCLNTAMADAMDHLANKLEAGQNIRDAVADLFRESRRVFYSGDNYSEEWKAEYEKRGLVNLKNTVDAADSLASEKNVKLFESQRVLARDELFARQTCIYEAYTNISLIEANCMIRMINTGLIPACATDMNLYSGESAFLAGDRKKVYAALAQNNKELEKAVHAFGSVVGDPAQARFCLEKLKPAMEKVRESADQAELLMQKSLYPYPSYAEILYQHLSDNELKGGETFQKPPAQQPSLVDVPPPASATVHFSKVDGKSGNGSCAYVSKL